MAIAVLVRLRVLLLVRLWVVVAGPHRRLLKVRQAELWDLLLALALALPLALALMQAVSYQPARQPPQQPQQQPL